VAKTPVFNVWHPVLWTDLHEKALRTALDLLTHDTALDIETEGKAATEKLAEYAHKGHPDYPEIMFEKTGDNRFAAYRSLVLIPNKTQP
jgi:hypothetical protein